MAKRNTWTDDEKQFVLDNASTMKDAELTAALKDKFNKNVSMQTVRKQRIALGIKKEAGRGVCKVRPSQTNLVTDGPNSPVQVDDSSDVVVSGNEVRDSTFMFTP